VAKKKKTTKPGPPYQVGKNYFIRGVTMYYTGRLVQVTEQELVLEDAAWIACTRRFADTFREGVFDEVEPFPPGPVVVGRGSIVDACLWPHALPREQK
jgi:hypothetical protein